MLKKTNRLDRRLFNQCFGQGKRLHSTNLTAVFLPYEDFRCAVVVGKKVQKKAVLRNQFRRKVYGIIEVLTRKCDKKISGLYIFLLKPSVKNMTKKEFREKMLLEVGMILNKKVE